MVSTLLVHTTTHGPDHSRDVGKPIYTFHESSITLPPSEQPPASIFKESMDAPTNLADSHLKRVLTSNAQRLHTDVKGLWNSAPRSAHPAGTYERGVNYPRLFRLDSSYGLSVKELPGRQGFKPAPDFRLTAMATNTAPTKAFSDRQSSICMSNPVESVRQVRSRVVSLSDQLWWSAHMTARGYVQRASRDTSDTKLRDVPMAPASYQSYDDRISPADREVVTREVAPVRGWRVNAGIPHATSAPYLRKWPAEADRPIRVRSLSEAADNGRRAFRAMADWITIYLFALVDGGRLPQDGAIEYVLSEHREVTCH